MYNFYFQRKSGERIELLRNCSVKKAMSKMISFLEEHNFKSYYTRSWTEGDETWFDVGSHTEFFILKENKVSEY